MILILFGLVLWYVTHLLPSWAPAHRAALMAQFGEGPYKIAIAILTAAAIGLMTIGYQQADYIGIWAPPGFLVHVNTLLMIVAVIVFIAGRIPSGVRRIVRHPQFTATKIWAVAHLLVNGDLASIVLFGGILAWAVIALIGTNRRDGKPAITVNATLGGTAINLGAGVAVFGVVAGVHTYLGVWPFAV